MKTLLTITLFLLCLSLRAGTTVYFAPNETGRIEYLKLCELSGTIAIDYSGNQNNAMLTNTPTWTNNSVIGSGSLLLNGTSQYATIAASSSLNPSNISVCIWVNPLALTANNEIVSMPYRNSGWTSPYLSYIMQVSNAALLPSFQISSSGVNYFALAGSSLPLNKWTFLVGTYDGSSVKFYTNAVLAATTSHIGTIDYNGGGNNLCVGQRSTYSPGEYCNTMTQELSIYNRALSATEITNLYNFRQTTYLTNGTTPFKP